MSKRVSPTERVRAQIDELFASGRSLAENLEDVAKLTVRLMLQVAVEAEVDEFLGRARYEKRTDEHPAGSRNGWQPPAAIKSTMGAVELRRPKLRGTDEKLLFGSGVTRTNALEALEALVISGWVRGLSDRDIAAALAEVLGPEAALSKSTVSVICQQIRTEFDAWRTRDLSGLRIDYLYLDGSHFRMHPNSPAEPVLAAWGIDTDGRPVFVGLAAARSESTDAWGDFLADLEARGLRPPVLVISDRAPGLLAAIEAGSETSLRQSCLIHRLRETSSPRCPSTTGTSSRPATGRSSTTSTPNPATVPSPKRHGVPAGLPTSGPRPTRVPSSACKPISGRSARTYGSLASTGSASGTPTSSNAPSARADDG